MQVILTTCTAEKDPSPAPVAAGRRYRGARVEEARALARAQGLPLVFLSGVFGLVGEHEAIPWYDHALEPDEVEVMTGTVAAGLGRRGITRVCAVMRAPSVPGWAPYRSVLEQAAARAGVAVEWRRPRAAGVD